MGHVQVLEHLLSDSLEDRSRYLTALMKSDCGVQNHGHGDRGIVNGSKARERSHVLGMGVGAGVGIHLLRGNRIPGCWPKPKARMYLSKRSSPRRRAILIAPTSLDSASTSATDSTPCGLLSRMRMPLITMEPIWQSNISSGLVSFSSSAPEMVTSLNVEPGS